MNNEDVLPILPHTTIWDAPEHAPLLPVMEEPTPTIESAIEITEGQNRFVRGWHTLGTKWLSGCVRTSVVIDTLNGEYLEGLEKADTKLEKAQLTRIAGTALVGQVYERVRIPEVVGIAATTNTYRIMMERGWNPAIATSVAALALGLVVYVQQKFIGKNFVKTAEIFPDTYETVNQMWPKTMDAIKNATPNPKHRIAEGATMFGLVTTPFIASAKATNKDITSPELYAIERRVTRRGSAFAVGVGAIALGVKSLAPHLREEVALGDAHFNLRENVVNWTNNAIDVISNPWYLVAGLMGASVLGKLYTKLKHSSDPETA